MNTYDQLLEIVEQQGKLVKSLDLGKERTVAIADYARLHSRLMEKETLDENVLDRRTQMDEELELKKKELEFKEKELEFERTKFELEKTKSMDSIEIAHQTLELEFERRHGVSKDTMIKCGTIGGVFLLGEIASNFGFIRAKASDLFRML